MTLPSVAGVSTRSGDYLIDWITADEDAVPVVAGLVVDCWWLAHDESGTPLLSSSDTGGAMGIALAAALLGDLALGRKLGINRDGALTVHRPDEPPSDALAHHVFSQIRNSAPYALADWLAALAVDAHARVAARLEADGLVDAVNVRRRRRVLIHYPPTPDYHLAAVQPAVLLSRRLARGELVSAHDALLVAIAGATGLRRVLVEDSGREIDGYARHVISGLDGICRDIALATRTALTRAVLTRRS